MLQYKETMEDSMYYIAWKLDKDLDIEEVGQLYSYHSGYYATYFSSYFVMPFYRLLEKVKEKKGDRPCSDVYEELESYISGFTRKDFENEITTSFKKLPHGIIKDITSINVQEEYQDDPLKSWELQCSDRQKCYPDNTMHTSLWWYDTGLRQHFSIGRLCFDGIGDEEVSGEIPNEEQRYIPLKKKDYVVFAAKLTPGKQMSDVMKELIHYAHDSWLPEHEDEYRVQDLCLQVLQNGECRYYVPVEKKKSGTASPAQYDIEKWPDYIDEHIMENINVGQLAERFHYSTRQVKRIFFKCFGVPLVDYIRKSRLSILANEIRHGADYKKIAELYGFYSWKGFKRAFEKEFGVTPKEYVKDTFGVIETQKYLADNKDKIDIRMTNIDEINVLAHVEIDARGDDVDIPAQMQYWLNRDYPGTASSSFRNRIKEEDKIAMWYHDATFPDMVEYVIGSVVSDFPEAMDDGEIPITIKGGRYAVFETRDNTDQDVERVLRLFSRYVFYGWLEEHRDEVDWWKIAFERYVNHKVYIYVGLKEE